VSVIYSTDKRNNIIYIVWDGEINADTWLNQVSALSAEPDWPSISRVVNDTRTASTHVSPDDIKNAAELFGVQPTALRNKQVAVIANHMFDTALEFSHLMEPYGVSMIIFNELNTACTFLGLHTPTASQRLDELRLQLRSSSDLSSDSMTQL